MQSCSTNQVNQMTSDPKIETICEPDLHVHSD